MSQGVLDRTTFEAIEAYVLDRMSNDERRAFEQRMASDGALREEMELERENIRAVELGGLQRVMVVIGKEATVERADKEVKKGGARSFLRVAAVVSIILSGAFWVLTRPSKNDRIFAEYFEVDPGLPVAMGAADNPAFADAMVSFKEGEFAEARAKWEPLWQQEPMNDTLCYYIANAALAMEDATAAIPPLESVAANASSAFHDKAQWCLFLAYVKVGDVPKARTAPINDPVYAERASAIKAQL